MEALLLDPANADTRVEFGMAEAEVAQRAQWRASAEVFRAIDATMREAAAHPEVFIDAMMLRGDAVEYAERAAAADLAVRLNIAEATVRAHGHVAATLRQRLPRVWAWFSEGEVSTQNAREAASIASELPADYWAAFEDRIVDAARTLAPARFRSRARAVREKLHADTLAERHVAAETRRGVWTEVDRDGMGWLNALLPADALASITANLDGIAFGLFTEADELRTMSQLRADVLTDLVTGAGSDGGSKVGFTVALTIPVLSLLGQSTKPALLEGVGPIDLETARRLCATAPSITRLLTDPISGDIIGMDPKQYRSTAPLKRWLAITQVTCDFPGCGRRAINCDLDHTTAWADCGQTTADNLTHRCRKHHTMKHQTKWRVDRPPGAERAVWTSPTGYRREADPPPF
ncbi:MAG: DUF222 domain-containing protein [Rhodoglobus sp.]